MQVFDTFLQSGALPYALVEAHGPPPPGWEFIGFAVEQAYATHVVTEDGSVFGAPKKGKGGGKGCGKKGPGRAPKPPNPLLADIPHGPCRDYLLGRCKRGDDCRFPHDDALKAE